MKDNTSYNKDMNDLVKYKLQKKNDPFAFNMVAQMILDESLHAHQMKRYKEKIDEALEKRDEKQFMKLTDEYIKFLG
ncbi:IDEAL domain-containing protein [Fictibacillus sp. KU28468]|uniref:IDEAL domain-containing protein n=1 Tax=Fictibacillus sp. KU28468 TaxID=2991053 RepID=UPI00223D7D20|nr:IDEAL domain-containing protein [Fictibacillus sp. KU28468]UZJ77542.1 IDEAL domain-containing protein [Fictibacillus sp. KU28468]